MARRHHWDGIIDNLPPEILIYNIEETPRSILRDIANRLNADSISAGNWESLAEKLGFIQNSMLEHLTQQAKVQNTYPGLLMLQEWSRRNGSTAHVLLHALREIRRDDVVDVLVNRLYELHMMQLSISIQDGSGPPKFLRVPTRKSAPLHASLDNLLDKPPYWYNITGPRRDITWNTPSGQLQGTQLTLVQRCEPSQDSMSDIYGTAPRPCRPSAEPVAVPLQMNIPPDVDVGAERGATPMVNDLSGNSPSTSRQHASQQSPDPTPNLPPPPVCGPHSLRASDPDRVLDNLEPMTDFEAQFPHFSALVTMSSDFGDQPPAAPSNSGVCAHSMEEGCVDSYTQAKQPLLPGDQSEQHEDTLVKDRAKRCSENQDMMLSSKHKQLHLAEMVPPTASEKSPSTVSSSLMHADYIAHDSLIHFSNNPTSPQSFDSDPSFTSGTNSDDHPQFVKMKVAEPKHIAEIQHQDSPPPHHRPMAHSASDYVPLAFIEQQSQKFQRESSGSMVNEEHMQTHERQASEHTFAEDMDCTDNSVKTSSHPSLAEASSTSSFSDISTSKPPPCTYTSYFPGMSNSQEQYIGFQPRPIPHSVSLDQAGYLDMSGIHESTSPRKQHGHTPSPALQGIHCCMSVDSYMNTRCTCHERQAGATNSELVSRNRSEPDLDRFAQSRDRRPLAGQGDIFQARDRRPLRQEHEMLLDEPEPEYSYIDGVSAGGAGSPRATSSTSSSSTIAEPDQQRSPRGASAGRRNSDEHRQQRQRSSSSSSALQQVPGGNPDVNDRTVEHEMERYINEDGNFIVWYYDVRSQFVISVSHLRSIRHYAVYESDRTGQVYYYIFPRGARFTSLAALVQHCQVHGVTEPTKTIKNFDGRQVHRSSGRFSHVRLKFPIPKKKN